MTREDESPGGMDLVLRYRLCEGCVVGSTADDAMRYESAFTGPWHLERKRGNISRIRDNSLSRVSIKSQERIRHSYPTVRMTRKTKKKKRQHS